MNVLYAFLFTSLGVVAVWLTQRRAAQNLLAPSKDLPRDPEPICGCSHHYALHTEEGACGSQASERLLVERSNPVVKETGMYGDNHKVFYENERWEVVTRDCPCKRYTGPEPMPRYLP